MEKVNIIVVGAGVIGLAVGYELTQTYPDVFVVEKEDSFGQHTSSRNSEVIHSGLYYPQNSLKAKLCLKGNQLLYDFLKKYEIPHQNCGKLVVACNDEEVEALYKLKANGERNNLQGLEIYNQSQCLELEPQVKAVKAIWVPSTGILDTHRLMKTFERLIEENNGAVAYRREVEKIEKDKDGYILTFTDGEQCKAAIVINCAGLFSEKIARSAGLDTAKLGLRMYWSKGEYYKTTKIKNIRRLIYPVPDPKGHHLGIHLTINLDGEVRFGPNAYYVDNLNYNMDETYRDVFFKAVNTYLDVDREFLTPDGTGIRPKLQGPEDPVRDFYIAEQSANGLPNFINLTGIESPGLTSCLAIAEYVKTIVAAHHKF